MRASLSFWLYVAIALVCVGVVLWVLIDPDARPHLIEILPIPLITVAVGWVMLGWPAVVFDRDRIEIRNPLVTHFVPLDAIADTSTERGFSVTTHDGKRIYAWAAPPPDRIGAWRAGDAAAAFARDPRLASLPDEDRKSTIRTSQTPGSPSGDSALILAHQRRARELRAHENRAAGRGESNTPAATVSRHWNFVNIAVLLLLPAALLGLTQLQVNG